MDLKELNELKARAYDLLATIEACQRELGQVNQEIAKKHREEPKEKE